MDLKRAFDGALSYDAYIAILGQHLSLHRLHYKKCIIDHDLVVHIKSLKPANILVITEPWCGDSLALLPVMKKVAEINGQWNIKVCRRDDNPELMDQFLTDGMRAIPIFLFLNDDFDPLFRWGPRPKATAKIYADHRDLIEEGMIDKQEVIKKIRSFYAKDRGKTSLAEFMKLAGQFLSD